ncbi:Alpha/Beta hydrolase protein [Hygrophoropsis aurantiaca]|uniref:Alpha/Beta hydrolase protein n=1 Tax=Hygrophoropsis aurantiaca TaxID=72124 RepID=A0ACB8ANU0_9AGAM|nr:Alpha/Beta hydrolase protein [Hygrophoropsis aurantiaca]
MDLIAKNKETDIGKISLYTLSAFVPILDEKKEEIEKIEQKTFQYGPRNRHHLDVYYPLEPSVTANGKTPILFFIYGGGFNTGARQLPFPYNMGYRALGSFFAQRGFITIIPDYRLVPEVRYPAASEDIRDAIVWVSKNVPTITSTSIPEPDLDYVFVMSHSAGTVHTKVLTLHPELRVTLPPLKGLIWCAGAWFLNIKGEKFETEGPASFYFGSPEQQSEREPRALWNKLSDEEVEALPEILLVQAEREPEWMKISCDTLAKDLENRLGKAPKRIISQGHNHISPNWALSSGEGEAWGEEVAEWLNARILGTIA